jgi:hypothetical protein
MSELNGNILLIGLFLYPMTSVLYYLQTASLRSSGQEVVSIGWDTGGGGNHDGIPFDRFDRKRGFQASRCYYVHMGTWG